MQSGRGDASWPLHVEPSVHADALCTRFPTGGTVGTFGTSCFSIRVKRCVDEQMFLEGLTETHTPRSGAALQRVRVAEGVAPASGALSVRPLPRCSWIALRGGQEHHGTLDCPWPQSAVGNHLLE